MGDDPDARRFPPYPSYYPPGMPHPPPHLGPPGSHPSFYPPTYFPPPPPPKEVEIEYVPEPEPEPAPIELMPEPAPTHTYGYGGYYWVDCDVSRGVYPAAIMGGVDSDGTQIYVGRAYHGGDWIPAKVIPEKNIAYVAYGGKEVPVHHYQLLCEQRFEWVPCSGGDIPPNAVIGGRTSDGEHLYIGRVEHEGSNTIGKVHPSHNSLYIPYDGEEVAYSDYEILILR
ncbi:uncharacterized protein [Onthophagus taurus]|uniref:uncharacterized protein n=1 Tax=Onthophagus taurus TaxID=166361 RepID=UPI000C20470C|nr:uncharacterized protein LOC111428551 [Onthophagus taurus]